MWTMWCVQVKCQLNSQSVHIKCIDISINIWAIDCWSIFASEASGSGVSTFRMKKFSTPVPEAVSNFRLYVVYHRRRVIARKSNNSRGQFSRNFAYRVYTYYCAPRSHTIHVKYVYLDVHIRFRRTSFFFFSYINFLFYFTIYICYIMLWKSDTSAAKKIE